MFVHSLCIVCQKALRNGMTEEGGRMERREEREVQRACCGRGRSDIQRL
jgi:hypothetical protein